MALPASDAFTRADSASLGANWTQAEAGGATPLAIVSNQAKYGVVSGADAFGRWSADAFGNDHYAECKAYSVGGAYGHGPIVRASATPTTCYWALIDSATTVSIYLMPGFTLIGAQFTGLTVVDGDTWRLSVSGTTLTLSQNGTSRGTRTDANLASGSAGIGIYAQRAILDDFAADNVSAGGGSNWAPMLSDRWNRLVL